MKQMKILRTLIIFSSILIIWNPLVWGVVPQKDKQDDLFYWLWNDDDISRKAQQIVWWQARLGETKKKKVLFFSCKVGFAYLYGTYSAPRSRAPCRAAQWAQRS